MQVIKVEDEDYRDGIISFYDKIAKKLNLNVEPEDKYDCTKIDIARNIQDFWFSLYEPQGFSGSDVAMLLLMSGPKVNELLHTDQVSVNEGFIVKGGN